MNWNQHTLSHLGEGNGVYERYSWAQGRTHSRMTSPRALLHQIQALPHWMDPDQRDPVYLTSKTSEPSRLGETKPSHTVREHGTHRWLYLAMKRLTS